MEHASVVAIVRALNQAGAGYMIAGGLAVVAHGYVRFTADIDLLLDLDPPSLERSLEALAGMGYRPRAPVELDAFLVPENRRRWI